MKLIFSLCTVLLMAGCSSDKIRPLSGGPPVPYLIVPEGFLISGIAGMEKLNTARMEHGLASKRPHSVAQRVASRLGKSCQAMSAFDAGMIAGATAYATSPHGAGSHNPRGLELPPGRYRAMNRDDRGYFYQAPKLIMLDGDVAVTGGLYWKDGDSNVSGYYYFDEGYDFPLVHYTRKIARQVIIPTERRALMDDRPEE